MTRESLQQVFGEQRIPNRLLSTSDAASSRFVDAIPENRNSTGIPPECRTLAPTPFSNSL